ncbi:hypothetical protein CABS01_01647, partial [Colletotrichum abscissum]|uniref:uncharacterized protein n=1 Tax=Colletotrichum abscissum TaxID=1671311 RepID=UPI0027D4E305
KAKALGRARGGTFQNVLGSHRIPGDKWIVKSQDSPYDEYASESDSNDETEEGPRNDNEAKSLPNMSHRCCSFPQHCSFLFPMETKDDGWIAGGGTTDAGKGTAFLLASTFSFSLPARPSIAATFPLKAVRH